MYKLKVSGRGAKKALAKLSRRKLLGRYSLLATAIGLIALVALSTGAYALFLGGTSGTNPSTSVNLQAGLVGEWKLNGNAKDSTPYSHNGTLINSPMPTTGPNGQANSAYAFNGSSAQYIALPANSALNPGLGSMTWSTWFNTTATTQDFVYRNSASCNDLGFILATNANGSVTGYLSYYSAGACTGSSVSVTATSPGTTYNNGAWHLATVVLNRTADTLTLYMDGQSVASVSASAIAGINMTSAATGTIGGISQYFTGSISDFRIYNRALNANEVNALYHEAGNGLNTDTAEAGLVAGYWQLNGNAKDSTPYSDNGTIVGNVTPTTDRNGTANGAMSFDGSSYINIPNSSAFTIGSSGFTYSAWVYPTTLNTSFNMITGHLLPYLAIYSTGGGTGRLYMSLEAGGTQRAIEGGTTLTTNHWYYVTATYDSSGYMRVYVNGTLDGTGGPFTPITNYSTSQYIGQYSSSGTYRFTGSIADLRIYNQALTASQIANLYTSGSSQITLDVGGANNPAQNINLSQGLVAYYPFNDNAKDATPYSDNGTVNGATLTTDRFGNANSAYSFSGATGNNITVASTFGLGAANLTISCWAYVPSTSDHGAFVKIGGPAANGYAIGMGGTSGTYDTNGDAFLLLYEGVRWIATGTAIPVGWHLFTMTINGSGVPSAYMDGSLLGSYSGNPPVVPTSSQTFIGGYTSSTPSNRYFNGSVDEVRIYNRALSAAEVSALYSEN